MCWGMWRSFLTAWVLPATTAKRTQHLPLRRALTAHLVAVALTWALMVILPHWANPYGSGSVSSVLTELRDTVGQYVLDWQRDPWQSLDSLMRLVIPIEVGLLGLTLVIMPWGARDESFRGSYVHTLRRVWLQTTHVIPIVLLLGGVAIGLASAERAWWRDHPIPTGRPKLALAPELSPGDSGYENARLEYDVAKRQYDRQMLEFEKRWQAWSQTVPWYVGVLPDLMVWGWLLAATWFLGAVLRAVGAPRTVLPVTRSPMCEACGYSLIRMGTDCRCPECGEPVGRSLGLDARSGVVWEHRSKEGRLKAWWRCGIEAVFHPTRLGRQVRLSSQGDDHRRFLLLHLPFVLGMGFFGFLAYGRTGLTTSRPFIEPMLILVEYITVFGVGGVVGTVLLTNLAALLAAAWYGLLTRRNLMPGSIQVACYLSGYLALMIGFAAASGAAVATLHDDRFFRTTAQFLQIGEGALAVSIWLMPNLIWWILYFVLVFRGTAAIRYANR